MAIQLQDRILTLCTTVGTNDAIIGATKEGYQGWEGITIGNTVYYCITDDTAWEVGYGQYLSRAGTPTIVRNVLDSNTGEKLDLTGNSSIFCTYPSEKAVFLNTDGNMYYPSTNINASKFIGDGSALTNLPIDNVWKDNGLAIQFDGDGSSSTQVVAENNGKQAKMTQKSNGLTYFTGEGATYFGTEADEVVKIVTNGTAQMAVSSNSVNAFQPFTAPEFIGNGAKITNIDAELNNLTPEAPTDGETYARNNKTWVSISDSSGIPDAPVDGLMYGRQDGEWNPVADADDVYTKTETNTLLDEKADKATTYTKAEVDVIDNAQDAKIVINNDEIARQQIEITNNSANITKNDGAINTNITNIATNTSNISSNTTAIGTLSGQVGQNSEDIAELQDSIFFSSAYSADYPSAPNRDPENGNMYLQNVALFTYSYASATQIFASKTDESGNVRQFTAIQAGDSIVLNEVDSPNYGRYELVSVEDVSDSYVVMNVIPKKGQGTVITGVKVAFQAFPKPDSASIWTDVGGVATYDGAINVNKDTSGTYATFTGSSDGGRGLEFSSADVVAGATFYGASHKLNVKSGQGELTFSINDFEAMNINNVQEVSTVRDMTVNGVTVGKGSGSLASNVVLGSNVLENNSSGNYNTAVGNIALLINDSGSYNTGLGCSALQNNASGNSNTAVGYGSLGLATGNSNTGMGNGTGSTLTTGTNNLILGANANTSSPTVSNEVTIGDSNVTTVRMGNGDVIYPASNSIWTESGGETVTYTSTGNTTVLANANSGQYASYQVDNADQKYSMQIRPDQANAFVIRNETTSQNLMTITTDGGVSTTQDITVNGVNIGAGSGSGNTLMGTDALSGLTTGGSNVAFGDGALLQVSEDGKNTALGNNAGSNLVSGENNILIGFNAQPSNSTVSNEVTIGSDAVTKVRFGDGLGVMTLNRSADTGNSMGFTIDDSDAEAMFITAGKFYSPAIWANEVADAPNVVIRSDGQMYKSSTAFYSSKEVDGLISTKDKVIDALSARLDSLELKFKALK